ncbi:MAG TPA: DUF6049 family protein [Glaciihabitans sp.]|nr:DUF6049 family protein [Glaciihabitans sp.]
MNFKPVRAAIALMLGLTGIGATTPITPQSTADAPSGEITMTVSPNALGMPSAIEPLHLTVTITNQTDAELDAGTVEAAVNTTRFSANDDLAGWLSDAEDSVAASTEVASVDSSAIAAGETRIVDVQVPTADLGFTEEGVYALGVNFDTGDDVLAHARTAITWKTTATSPLEIAIAAPLTLPLGTPGLIDAATLEEYTAEGGLLTEQLDAMAGSAVTIGIDPRILASIRILGTSAPESAVRWLERLRTVPNATFPLAYADADVTLPITVGGGAPLTPTSFDYAIDPSLFANEDDTADAPDPTAPDSPPLPELPTSAELTVWDYTFPRLAWPADNSVTSETLGALTVAGYSPTILSSNNITRTPTPTSSGVEAVIGDSATIVSDQAISDLLRTATEATTVAEWNIAMAQLSATVALASELASPTDPTVFATLSRAWTSDEYRLEQTLTALNSLPWASPSSLIAALQSQQVTPALGEVVDASVDQDTLDTVNRLLTSEAQVGQFANIVADRDALTAERRNDLLPVLSTGWRENPDGWADAANEFVDESDAILESVQIAPSSTIQLPSDRGSLPIAVNNSLTQAVTVYVSVRPRSPALSVDSDYTFVEMTVEPESSQTVRIPVRSLANGEVQLTVTISDKDGNPIGQSTNIELNVHAGWETAGTIAFAVLVVLIFGLGIFRTIRKRRRVRRSAE